MSELRFPTAGLGWVVSQCKRAGVKPAHFTNITADAGSWKMPPLLSADPHAAPLRSLIFGSLPRMAGSIEGRFAQLTFIWRSVCNSQTPLEDALLYIAEQGKRMRSKQLRQSWLQLQTHLCPMTAAEEDLGITNLHVLAAGFSVYASQFLDAVLYVDTANGTVAAIHKDQALGILNGQPIGLKEDGPRLSPAGLIRLLYEYRDYPPMGLHPAVVKLRNLVLCESPAVGSPQECLDICYLAGIADRMSWAEDSSTPSITWKEAARYAEEYVMSRLETVGSAKSNLVTDLLGTRVHSSSEALDLLKQANAVLHDESIADAYRLRQVEQLLVPGVCARSTFLREVCKKTTIAGEPLTAKFMATIHLGLTKLALQEQSRLDTAKEKLDAERNRGHKLFSSRKWGSLQRGEASPATDPAVDGRQHDAGEDAEPAPSPGSAWSFPDAPRG